MKERIQKLVDELNQYRKEYYTQDQPTVSDSEYDKLYRELVELEKSNPDLILPDSPTQAVGGLILDGFEKYQHETPLYSLQDAFSREELDDFDRRVKAEFPNASYMAELKTVYFKLVQHVVMVQSVKISLKMSNASKTFHTNWKSL